MSFPMTCRACGHENSYVLSQVGRDINCGGCGVAIKAPAPKEKVGKAADAPGTVRFACPACGRKYATKVELAGKKIRCGGCGAGVRVPAAPAQPVAAQPATPAMKTFGSAGSNGGPPMGTPAMAQALDEPLDLPTSLFDDEEDEESSDPYALAGGDLDGEAEVAEPALPSRAEMLDKARQKAEEQAVEAEKIVKKKKKKKKKSGYFEAKDTLILIGCVMAGVAVVTGLAVAFPDMRFPIGGLLCIVGFITYLVGAFQLRQLVAEEGFIQVLLFRFFPPYQWWFVISRWSETRDFFAFFASGLIVLALGGAILKTSPIGKKAAESEAAYQRAHGGDGVEVIPLDGDDDEE